MNLNQNLQTSYQYKIQLKRYSARTSATAPHENAESRNMRTWSHLLVLM